MNAPGPWFVFAKERWHQDQVFCYDLVLQTPLGQIREVWEGLHLRRVSPILWPTGWKESLFIPYIERQFQEFIPTVPLQVTMHHEATADRSVRTQYAVQKLLGAEAKVTYRPDGKPEILHADWNISATHAGELTLVVASSTEVACDMEWVVNREEQTWKDLLGHEGDLVKAIQQSTNEDDEYSATRVWTLKECLKKAGALRETPLVIKETNQEGWILFGAGEKMLMVSVVTRLQAYSVPLALAILVSKSLSVSVMPAEAGIHHD